MAVTLYIYNYYVYKVYHVWLFRRFIGFFGHGFTNIINMSHMVQSLLGHEIKLKIQAHIMHILTLKLTSY